MNVAGLHWNHKLLILRVNLFISLPSHNSVQTYSTAGWNSKSLQKWYRYVRKTKLYKTVMTKWAFFRKLWRTTRTTDVAERPTVKSPWQFLREFTTCAERCANEYRGGVGGKVVYGRLLTLNALLMVYIFSLSVFLSFFPSSFFSFFPPLNGSCTP